MPTRIAINGFGRIGRSVLRSAVERDADLEIVAVNDVTDVQTLAHPLRLDSVYGRFGCSVTAEDARSSSGSAASACSPSPIPARSRGRSWAPTWSSRPAAGSARTPTRRGTSRRAPPRSSSRRRGRASGETRYIPAGSAARILDAVTLLRDMESGAPPRLGRRIVVYGGGNTAMDAARTARRLGAEEAIVVYRRTRDRMPAHDSELQEALEEGVLVKWLSTVKHADGGKLQIERMKLDADGFPQPTGELEELGADSLVLALGQETDLSLLERSPGVELEDGTVRVGADLMTGRPGVFAGGDIVPAERTVTMAIGHGRTAAGHIDAWLCGARLAVAEPAAPVGLDGLNPWYYTDAPRTVRPQLELARRQSTFDEVSGGLDASNALFEARRCLSCGSCFACDNCFGVCPDNAVIKFEPGGAHAYAIDLDYCRGCGICAQDCPCGAIEMEPEEV